MSSLRVVAVPARHGTVERASGQGGDEGTLVGDRTTLVGGRVAVLGGDGGRLADPFFGGRATPQEVFGLARDELACSDRGQPDADLGECVPLESEGGPRRGDGPIPGPPLDLLVSRRRGLDRYLDLDEQFTVDKCRLIRAGQEIPARHRALPART